MCNEANIEPNLSNANIQAQNPPGPPSPEIPQDSDCNFLDTIDKFILIHI